MNATLEPIVAERNPSLREIIKSACRRIPPLWPLKNFVAVNPFLGLSDRQFVAAQPQHETGRNQRRLVALPFH